MYRSPIQGHHLVSADYKSLEMFTACEAMHRLGIQNGPLRQVLDAEGDIHINTARLLFGECNGKEDPKRRVAKVCNFALLGGMGPPNFLKTARAAGFDWNLAKATEIREAWFRAFHDCAAFLGLFKIDPWSLRPPVYHKKGWLELNDIPTDPWPSRWELSHALNDGAVYCVRLPDGRIVPNRRYSQAANIFFQGLGADVVSLAFNQACSQGLTVCIVVHDSITISAAPEDVDRAGGILVDQMKDAQERILSCGMKIPLPEYETGEYWS
jgi:DNA polymerase I-like protein with 3'-5' exonuclease and polymerase domains